ncbi:unnamed protein product [Adineta steineri]|uniref:c-SKI SMAD4-binding domain-containing protein n=1 Tax=Adineta steineri TaxID=433720 RepID=A0A818MQB2_9BILA|nr:unnamed protein product [Adineta steineri]
MIMTTNTNRILEHLNIFSVDHYKKQQQQQHQQQHYDEIKMNLTSDQHDNILQSNIKDEKTDHHVDNTHLKTSPTSIPNIDQPLLIVLDEDDINTDDENEHINLKTSEIKLQSDSPTNEGQKTNSSNKITPTAKQSINKSKNSRKSNTNTLSDSKLFRRPRKPGLSSLLNDCNQQQPSDKFFRTVVIDTTFMRQTYQQQRNKLIARRKNSNTFSSSINMSNTKTHSIDDNSPILSSNDSILSNISFDNISNVLTVSRMGSIFYCLEDLYGKVFSSLCTLDEFTNLIIKPEIILTKQVTLSEKMSIEKQVPSLKKFHDIRFRLISINSSDYLLRLKQLLVPIKNLDETEKQKRIEQIIDEMRDYKRTPTPVLVKDNVLHSPMTTKRLSSDDDDDDDDEEHDEEPRKRLKIVTKKQKSNDTPPLAPTQFGIFIQCNGPVSCNIFSTNETVSQSSSSSTTTNSAETTTTTTTTTVAKTESEIIAKSTIIRKQNENDSKQNFLEKLQQQYSNIPKFNLNNEQFIPKSTILNRTDSQSPTDCNQINNICPSSTVMNMPIKRRILNSYNNDANDSSSSSTTAMHLSTRSINHSRYLYRSKSFTFKNNNNDQQNKSFARRSSSLSLIQYHTKEKFYNRKFHSTDNNNSKLNIKSKSEPIDLTDESYSMPMIVNVEENVEPSNQRDKIKCKKLITTTTKPKQSESVSISSESESRPPSTVNSRSTSHGSNPTTVLAKPTPTHHTTPTSTPTPTPSSYRPTPYVVYQHQESYTYREPSHNISSSPSMSHSYQHSTAIPHNTNLYPYSFSSNPQQYPIIKKTKEVSTPNSYDTRPNSVAPIHPSSSSSSVAVATAATKNNHHNTSLPSSVVMPIVRKPNYYQQLTPEQQASIKTQSSPPVQMQCRLPCCQPPHPSMQQQQQQQQQQQHPHLHQHHQQQQHQQLTSPHSTEKAMQNERYMYTSYVPSTPAQHTLKRDPSHTPDILNSSPSMNRKQRRVESIPPPSTTPFPPYSSTKPYFVPPPPIPSPASSNSSSLSSSHWPSLSPSQPTQNIKPSIRYPYPPPPNTPINNMTRKTDSYRPPPRRPIPVQSRPPLTTPVVAQNSSTLMSPPNTPHELTLPNIRTRSIDIQRAIIERGYCDMDKLPKLVVRHTKTYSNKTIDTMGQLFPTWFNEPDYRCIHCFRCDQVFTPQQFMTHVDDEHLQNEQPINMTSIQLLTSEKMSEYKVGLWNQFCTNLTIYARKDLIPSELILSYDLDERKWNIDTIEYKYIFETKLNHLYNNEHIPFEEQLRHVIDYLDNYFNNQSEQQKAKINLHRMNSFSWFRRLRNARRWSSQNVLTDSPAELQRYSAPEKSTKENNKEQILSVKTLAESFDTNNIHRTRTKTSSSSLQYPNEYNETQVLNKAPSISEIWLNVSLHGTNEKQENSTNHISEHLLKKLAEKFVKYFGGTFQCNVGHQCQLEYDGQVWHFIVLKFEFLTNQTCEPMKIPKTKIVFLIDGVPYYVRG